MSVTCFPECLKRLRECIRRESLYPFNEDGMRIYEKFVTAPERTCWIGPRRIGGTTALLFYISCALHMHDGLPIYIVGMEREEMMERLKTYVMPEDVPLLETKLFLCRNISHAQATANGGRARLVLEYGDMEETIKDNAWIVSLRGAFFEYYSTMGEDVLDERTNTYYMFDVPKCIPDGPVFSTFKLGVA